MRKFRSTRFSFIFKGRSVDFHRHMKKKSYKIISINYFMVIVYPGIVRKSCRSCEDFMNEQEKIYEYLHHGRKVCYTTEYQSGEN